MGPAVSKGSRWVSGAKNLLGSGRQPAGRGTMCKGRLFKRLATLMMLAAFSAG